MLGELTHYRGPDWAATAGRAVVVVFVLLYSLTVTGALPWQGEPRPLEVAVAVGLCFPWMLAGSRPALAVALMLATVAVQIVAGIPLVPGNLLVLLALYSLAARSRREVSLAGAGATILLLVVAALVHADDLGAAVPVLGAALIVLGAWAAGTNIKLRSAYERSLDERAEQLLREQDHLATIAAAQERTRIARDLHDVISHSLANILMLTEGTMRSSPHLHEKDREVLHHISGACRSSLGELRRLLQVLRDEPPEMTTSPTGVDVVTPALAGLTAAGIETEFVVEGRRRDITPRAQETLLRVVQEASTNVLKHGGAVTHVQVTLTFDDSGLDIEVVDDGDGAGSALGVDELSGGFGLRGMRERVALLEGTFDAGPRPGGGFAVRAHLPTTQFEALSPADHTRDDARPDHPVGVPARGDHDQDARRSG